MLKRNRLAPLVFAALCAACQPDPTDISTATGAAFYNRGDYGSALKIFQTLADQGNPRAQFNLGVMYANGHGVVQDNEQALKWYRLAADQKDVDAQNNLGVMYLRGRGVAQDPVRAYMWFSLAAAAPTTRDAQAGLTNREMVSAELTAAEIERARDLLRRCQLQTFKQCDGLTIASSSPPTPRRPPPTAQPPMPQSPKQAPQLAPAAPSPTPSTPPRSARGAFRWPIWVGLKPQMPQVVSFSEASAEEIFRSVSPSVFLVIAAATPDDLLRETPKSQGSAIAISSSELITNCHVVEGLPTIILKRRNEVGSAIVTHADPEGDRCFLKSMDLLLTPIKGVRESNGLAQGERVYTVGAPSGLELTIADGIISGLRRSDGIRYVQTSAPISSGSSGGGLFDARGNLVGVTTFLFRSGQNLNFAIAADEFWR